MLTYNAFCILVFLAGLVVFLDAISRIHEQFCKHTPLIIRVGMVLLAAGSLVFLYHPWLMGGLVIIGRALLLIGGRQPRSSIFHKSAR